MNPLDVATDNQRAYAAIRDNLAAFCVYDWPWFQLGPRGSFIRRTMAKLDDVYYRRTRRLIMTFPPRHYKTSTLKRHIAVGLGRDPDRSFMYLGATADLAEIVSGEIRDLLRSKTFRNIYPRIELSQDTQSKGLWRVNGRRGGLRATGIGGLITGMGATDIVVDDPFKDEDDAMSEATRDHVYRWLMSAAYTRLEPNPEEGTMIVVHTRWHEDDLIGRLKAKAREDPRADQYEELNFTALAEKDDILGRPVDAPLLFTREVYEKIRINEGPQRWAALYQQSPVPDAGALFRETDFIISDHAPLLARMYRYWDLALGTKETNDHTAGALVGLDEEDNLWILDVCRMRAEWPEVQQAILARAESDGDSTIVGVEDVAHQGAAIQMLRRQPRFLIVPLIAIPPKGKKDSRFRAAAWAARARAGKVRLLRGPWNHDFIKECLFFRGEDSKEDDQVDAVSGAANLILFTIGENRNARENYIPPTSFRGLELAEQRSADPGAGTRWGEPEPGSGDDFDLDD